MLMEYVAVKMFAMGSVACMSFARVHEYGPARMGVAVFIVLQGPSFDDLIFGCSRC